MLWISGEWKEYEVLDTSRGERLEDFVHILSEYRETHPKQAE